MKNQMTDVIAQRLTSSELEIIDGADLDKLNHIFNKGVSRLDDNYFVQRYLELFDSFVIFLRQPTATSFLGLQGPLPNDNTDYKMNAGFIQQIFDQLRTILCHEENQPQLKFIGKKDAEKTLVTEQIKVALSLPSEKDTRVYMLSSYATASVGFNFQHDLGRFETNWVKCIQPDFFNKKRDKRYQQVDLAGMYLGDITNLLSNVHFYEGMNSAFLKYLVQLEYLQDANEISRSEIVKQLSALARGVRIKKPQDTPSFMMSNTRLILQALGRMNRAFNKIEQLQIIASHRVITRLHTFGLDFDSLSKEFQSLIELKSHLVDANADDYENRKIALKNENFSFYSYKNVGWLVNGLQRDRDLADQYQNIRKFILSNPTISNERLRQYQNLNLTCLQYLPNNHQIKEYQVKKVNDYGKYEFITKSNDALMDVSANASGLTSMMKYQGKRQTMYDAFKDQGFATTWIPDDNIMNPVQYESLYKGVLGEVVGKFIIEDVFDTTLLPIEQLKNNELFDFKTNRKVLIDFKNWHSVHPMSLEQERQHVNEKLNIINQNSDEKWRVIIINILQLEKNFDFKFSMDVNKNIMEIPALIDSEGKLVLTPDEIKIVGAYLDGNK